MERKDENWSKKEKTHDTENRKKRRKSEIGKIKERIDTKTGNLE